LSARFPSSSVSTKLFPRMSSSFLVSALTSASTHLCSRSCNACDASRGCCISAWFCATDPLRAANPTASRTITFRIIRSSEPQYFGHQPDRYADPMAVPSPSGSAHSKPQPLNRAPAGWPRLATARWQGKSQKRQLLELRGLAQARSIRQSLKDLHPTAVDLRLRTEIDDRWGDSRVEPHFPRSRASEIGVQWCRF
jgi:hypothetical protein